jgi:hypothetical protein
MKLVEILAKELGEWPEGYRAIVQTIASLTLPVDKRPVSFDAGQWDYVEVSSEIYDAEFECSELATDHATAIVTREMWQAERNKQAAIQVGIDAANAGHTTPIADVKARYEHEDEDDSFSCEEYDPQPVSAETIGAAIFAYSNPVKWRDRIREIDASIEAMTVERAELVSKLAGEGFALIVQTAETVYDVGDWPADAPDRKCAPGWAQWIGRDRTGYYWFEGEPVAVKTIEREFARGLLGMNGYPDYRCDDARLISNDLPLWSCKL